MRLEQPSPAQSAAVSMSHSGLNLVGSHKVERAAALGPKLSWHLSKMGPGQVFSLLGSLTGTTQQLLWSSMCTTVLYLCEGHWGCSVPQASTVSSHSSHAVSPTQGECAALYSSFLVEVSVLLCLWASVLVSDLSWIQEATSLLLLFLALLYSSVWTSNLRETLFSAAHHSILPKVWDSWSTN